MEEKTKKQIQSLLDSGVMGLILDTFVKYSFDGKSRMSKFEMLIESKKFQKMVEEELIK